MQEKDICIKFAKTSLSKLSKQEQLLIETAKQAYNTAYAPYSGFLVGACLLLKNGKIISGSNQENVAYPSGICAERVALFYAGAQFPKVDIQTIAVSAKSKSFKITELISPCGSCRQVMAEYEEKQKKPIRLLLHNSDDSIIIVHKVSDLLPFLFRSPLLKRH